MVDDARFTYHRWLQQITEEDIRYVVRKDRQYMSSWKTRGGPGAFFTFARPWDRLESIASKQGYHIFKIIADEGLRGVDGTLLACVRDLRRYLMLLEAEVLERHEANRGRTEERVGEILDKMAHPDVDEGWCGGALGGPAPDVTDKAAQAEPREVVATVEYAAPEGFSAPIGRKVPRYSDAGASPRSPEDGGQHATLTPWVVSTQWRHKNNMHVGSGNEPLFSVLYRQVAPGTWVLESHIGADEMFQCQHAGQRHAAEKLVGTFSARGVLTPLRQGWVVDLANCPTDARDYYPRLRVEQNHKEWTDLPDWQQGLYTWDEAQTKYRLVESAAAWAAE